MAFAGTAGEIPFLRPTTCGGLQRPQAWRGDGTIAGTTKIDGTAAPCRVFLHASDGTLLGYRRSDSNGAYQFLGLAPGDYRLVVEDDSRGIRRGKIELVTVAG